MKKNKLCFIALIGVVLCLIGTVSFAETSGDEAVPVAVASSADSNSSPVVDNNKKTLLHFGNNGIIYSDPQKPVVVKKGSPSFTITLQSNPSTGYSWSLKAIDSELIKPISRTFHAGKAGLAGAPGYEKWVFAVKPYGFIVPQTTNLTLIYARPWDLQGAQAVNFKVVTVNVD